MGECVIRASGASGVNGIARTRGPANREMIAARHSGMRVLGISCVTNAAAGILDQPLNHLEVLETAERVKGQFIGLLKAVIPRIAEAIA